MKILKMSFSRNGSGSADPFVSVLFEDNKSAKEYGDGVCGNNFVATFTQTKEDNPLGIDTDSIRVLNVQNFDLNWRGDWFARQLPEAIEEYCNRLKLSEISISSACFPTQYKNKTEKLKA